MIFENLSMPGFTEDMWILTSASLFNLLWYLRSCNLCKKPPHREKNESPKEQTMYSCFFEISFELVDPTKRILRTPKDPQTIL